MKAGTRQTHLKISFADRTIGFRLQSAEPPHLAYLPEFEYGVNLAVVIAMVSYT